MKIHITRLYPEEESARTLTSIQRKIQQLTKLPHDSQTPPKLLKPELLHHVLHFGLGTMSHLNGGPH